MDNPEIDLENIIHVGYRPERCNHPCGDLERQFAYKWLEVNTRPGASVPLLVRLLDTERDGSYSFSAISQRDAHVAATMMQWLGTNVGFGFLLEVLEQAGYDVREKRKYDLP